MEISIKVAMETLDKPFKAAPKYLPTIKYCLKPFQPALKSETLIVRFVPVMGAY